MEEAGLPPGVVNVVVAKGSSGVIEQMLHDLRSAQAVVHRVDRGGPDLAQGGRGPGAQCVDGARRQARPSSFSKTPIWTPALEGAMVAKMRNAGEACTAANRFLVHSSVAGKFTSMLAGAMGAMKLGSGIDRSNRSVP